MFLRRVMDGAGCSQELPTPLYEDNSSCRMMSKNAVSNDLSKHIDYRVHALRERVAGGIVRLVNCPSADMLADVLTKNLPAPDFARHRDVMAGLESHTSLELPDDLTIPGPRTTPRRAAKAAIKDRKRKELGMCSLDTCAHRRRMLDD